MLKRVQMLVLMLAVVAPAFAQPNKLDPINLHYYLFKGKPTVLITSAEHYGAVVNLGSTREMEGRNDEIRCIASMT